MIQGPVLRKIGMITLVLFCWFFLTQSFGFAQEEDALLKARKLYQQGYYDDAITLLVETINQLKSIVAQKKRVAEAFYLLAKVYFTVGEDDKVDSNLKKVFETYPTFEKQETDLDFKDRVNRARSEYVTEGPAEEGMELKKEEEKVVPPVVKTEQEPVQKEKEQQVIEKPKKKKKKKFPILLVLGGLAIAAVAIYFLVIKKSDDEDEGYDIRGTWTLNWSWYATGIDVPGTTTITFTGTKENGTFYTGTGNNGTYTVSGSQVNWYYPSGTTYTGGIQSDTFMSGTMIDYMGNPGTWSATRGVVKSGTGNRCRISDNQATVIQ